MTDSPIDPTTAAGPSRRSLLRTAGTAAWSVPAVIAVSAAPAMALSVAPTPGPTPGSSVPNPASITAAPAVTTSGSTYSIRCSATNNTTAPQDVALTQTHTLDNGRLSDGGHYIPGEKRGDLWVLSDASFIGANGQRVNDYSDTVYLRFETVKPIPAGATVPLPGTVWNCQDGAAPQGVLTTSLSSAAPTTNPADVRFAGPTTRSRNLQRSAAAPSGKHIITVS